MKTVYLLSTVLAAVGPLAADEEHAFDDAEADRLIALGVAVDPATRVSDVVAPDVDVAAAVQAATSALAVQHAEALAAKDATIASMQAALDTKSKK